jgi:hypothetical protein
MCLLDIKKYRLFYNALSNDNTTDQSTSTKTNKIWIKDKMNQNNFAILFTTNNFAVRVEPKFNNKFTVEEIYRLIKASDNEDLDRIEVFNGALYCFEQSSNKDLNEQASKFWFENARHMDRDGILGDSIFIPTNQDVYTGFDKYE